MSVVEHWLGPAFQTLHPLLQRLHLQGGRLRGDVHISVGKGWLRQHLGHGLAKFLGIPSQKPLCPFWVDIQHQPHAMVWSRFFAGRPLQSVFVPVGQWQGGHWEERYGGLRVQLGVQIVNSGWHWQLRRATWFGLPLPVQIKAFKSIEGERYRFGFEVQLKGLGPLLRYQGLLRLEPTRFGSTAAN